MKTELKSKTMSELVKQCNAQVQEWIESVNRNEELCLEYMDKGNATSLMMAGVYYERLMQAPNKLMELYVDVVIDSETHWALMHYVKSKTDAIVARAVAMDDER